MHSQHQGFKHLICLTERVSERNGGAEVVVSRPGDGDGEEEKEAETGCTGRWRNREKESKRIRKLENRYSRATLLPSLSYIAHALLKALLEFTGEMTHTFSVHFLILLFTDACVTHTF